MGELVREEEQVRFGGQDVCEDELEFFKGRSFPLVLIPHARQNHRPGLLLLSPESEREPLNTRRTER